jgi:hypothetical protein
MRHLPSLALAAIVFAIGCGDQPTTAPNVSRAPRFDISDGAHDDGNDGFFFLPPMVKEPVNNPKYKDEPFHGGMRPHIEICELASPTQCTAGEPFKRFAPEAISVGTAQYHVNWDTKEKPLVDGKHYRIQVFVGDVRLGYADVQHADNRSELKNLDTDEFVPLVDGRTLPIKFRIENGALCEFNAVCTSSFVDKDVGGTFFAADEGAAIHFDPGVLPVNVVVTTERVPVPPGAPCVPAAAARNAAFLQWEGCYRITTTPDIAAFGGFQGPTEGNPARAIVAVCIEPDVPANYRDNLVLHKFDEDGDPEVQRPEPVVPPFDFPCDGFTGTAPPSGAFKGLVRNAFGVFASAVSRLVGPRPLYAVDGGLGCILAFGDAMSTFFWGLPVTAEASAGDDQEAEVGTAVTVPPALTAVTLHLDDEEANAEPVSQLPVVFMVTGGGGTLLNPDGEEVSASDTVFTNAAGVAALPTGWQWRLGPASGTNTLMAFGPFEEGSVEFTATGTAVESGAITFETYPGGAATCAGCAVSGEYASRGLVFAFTPSDPEVEAPAPELVLMGNYDPVGSPPNHGVTAARSPDGGFWLGTVSMYFPHAPQRVQFRLRGNNAAENPYPVSAYTGPGWPVASGLITRTGVTTYTAGFDFTGREEIVTIESSDGISRVDVLMQSSLKFIDNVVIEDTPAGLLNFETTPDGAAICADGCDVTTAFATRGVSFSFESAHNEDGTPLTTKTNASICDGSRIDPMGFGSTNHLLTGPMGYPCGGGVAGQIIMTFDPAPTQVVFALRAPDGCSVPTLGVAVEGEAFGRGARAFSYTSGNNFPAAQYSVEWTHESGIDRVIVFPSGCDLYVDNLFLRYPIP